MSICTCPHTCPHAYACTCGSALPSEETMMRMPGRRPMRRRGRRTRRMRRVLSVSRAGKVSAARTAMEMRTIRKSSWCHALRRVMWSEAMGEA